MRYVTIPGLMGEDISPGSDNMQRFTRYMQDRCTEKGFQKYGKEILTIITKVLSKAHLAHLSSLCSLQEICQRPKFIAEGASRFDVEQGEQGDPWLLAAVSSLTLTPKFLDRVVPPDQNFEHGYCGVFR